MKNKIQPQWQLDAISKHSLDSIVIIDTDQRIRLATPSIANVFGYDPTNEKIQDFFQKIIHPDDMNFVHESYGHVVHKLKPGFSDHRCIDRHGNVIYVECRTTHLDGSEDNLTISIIRDVTEKKRMEMEIERRKNRYEVLQNSLKSFSHDLSSVMKIDDLEARLIKEVATILPGSEPLLIKNSNQAQTIGEQLLSELQPYLSSLSIGKCERIEHRYVVRIGDRTENTFFLVLDSKCTTDEADIIWLETLIYYARMVLESLNMIENLMNQLESSVQKSETPLWMLRLLFNLSEKERLNLSADLHDTVLQEQIVLDRTLKSVLQQSDMNRDTKEKLIEIEQGLEDTIHQIRSICNELRPPFLKEIGLQKALENLFEHTQTYNSNYEIHFTSDSLAHLSLDEEQTVGIYRIVQELINNATKHSHASHLYIKLQLVDRTLRFEYVDDGVGFELHKLQPSYSNMGLTSMIQRAETLLGKIEFFSEKDKGLKVIIQIPCKK